ncbi:sensor histidine kinase [Mediterraneibacter massiliensis]|uniref:sensor histidine kinase n=1 Tax=Mediterraneibacter massiliensis TaxID=1720300 RepID=UPI0022E5B706|nr:histidine kinase [Mediterraneibacter massiliensis]
MTLFKKKTSYSIRKFLYRYLLLLLLCSSAILIFYCIIIVTSYSDQMEYNTSSTIEYYSQLLETEMKQVATFQQKLCYSDQSFQLLTLKNLQDTERITLQYNVTEMLKRQVAPYESIFIFDKEHRIAASVSGETFFRDAPRYIYQLNDLLKTYWLQDTHTEYNQWLLFEEGYHPILMRALKVRNFYVCTAIDLENYEFLDYVGGDSTSLQFGFFNNRQLLIEHNSLTKNITLEQVKHPKNTFFSERYIMTAPINGTDIYMFCIFQSNYMGEFVKISTILFVIIAVISCGIILYTVYVFNKMLLYPLDRINAATKHLEQNDPSSFLEYSHSNIIEYQNINLALAQLINQKILLTNEKQAEAFEKNHAQLQYYQLQTNSHFFINCLKSLYNMLESKQYIKMQRMIIAFSNHLRYIFHDNLKLVTLQSELTEVNDYYNIILLDRVNPFILNIQVDDALLKCQVPVLLIQTFLENTAKYNKQSGNLLIFDVKIEAAVLHNEPVLQIMLSDNGIGYAPEILERLNNAENDMYAKEHVGISNLKRRISLIYKSNYQFAFYNKPSGGACALIYLPIKGELHETLPSAFKGESEK